MMLAYLKYRRILNTSNEEERNRLAREIQEELSAIVNAASQTYPPPQEIEHLGKKWSLGAPLKFDPKSILGWVKKTEELVLAQRLTIKKTE